MTGIEEFTSQYGLVRKIDAFGYLDYLKSNPDAPRKHGKVVPVSYTHLTLPTTPYV